MDGESSSDSKGAENLPNIDSEKRKNYISWEDYFMSVAVLSAQRSKDPNTKIVGIGYNGMPIGCSDDELPWKRSGEDDLDNKYLYVCHAEMNAIVNSNSMDLKKCTMYTTYFPCNECAKLIIQSGIKSIIYLRDKIDDPKFDAAKRMFAMTGISFTKFHPSVEQICIEFNRNEWQCSLKRSKNEPPVAVSGTHT